MTPELIPLCSIDIVMGESQMIGDGPAGFRVIAEVGSGTVSGDRVNGTLAGRAMADWFELRVAADRHICDATTR